MPYPSNYATVFHFSTGTRTTRSRVDLSTGQVLGLASDDSNTRSPPDALRRPPPHPNFRAFSGRGEPLAGPQKAFYGLRSTPATSESPHGHNPSSPRPPGGHFPWGSGRRACRRAGS